ncbi:P-loop containing nucleoside triphosphate hydrolase [Pseudocohnilembus persalinus]|uniref:p-loop containing nucleoside triphosphate hydrolase n=1 Tax=Pseudocohnilembus persalinus TaxID=266149 RepID=A0A0V0QDW1_PSEPJ|nr:P-loop containing nucleoside triphosphate hydrolase [Pseudocohnilembus persalinus]|eukprot:KRX00403.1 P-loop containing nucleoside triphosphate hydrolase [Pseudocohnilembus persalinus]
MFDRYVKGDVPKHDAPTIGVEFGTKTLNLPDNDQKVKLQIWDTSGQERYRSITSVHYRKALGALVVYDITSEKSYKNVHRWISELKEEAEQDVVVILVGNKLDIVNSDESKREVKFAAAQQYAKENNLLFMETSAKTNIKVKEIFDMLTQEIFKNKSQKLKDKPVSKFLQQQHTSQQSGDDSCNC